MGLFNFSSGWDFYTFLKETEKYNQTKYAPSFNKWASQISLTPEIWDHLLKIREYSTIENRERSVSFFWADGDVVTTEYARGQETFVNTKHSANLKYEPTSRPNYFEKQIVVDGKLVKKYSIDYNKIPKPPKVISLFNVHTHPKREEERGIYYNFFSGTDLNSLINSSNICTGLIIDKFWVACKSSEGVNFSLDVQEKLKALASKFTLKEVSIENEIRSFCEESKIVLYRAKYRGKLVRI
jgi:hypothetical protein